MRPKIVAQRIVAHVLNPYDRIVIMASYDPEGLLTLDTVMNVILKTNKFTYEYILGILNSRFAEWFYYWFVYNRAVRTMDLDAYYMGKLPIKEINSENQAIAEQIEKLVSQILQIKAQDPNANTQELERQIDQLVYQLYKLTPEEIELIERKLKQN
ncbi:MAG: TaqI-like C-terminal specificity domain-containing protein [candidate division WOR-3 bacterium]